MEGLRIWHLRPGRKYLFEYIQTFSVVTLFSDSTIVMYGFGRQHNFYNEARAVRNIEEKGSIATSTWNEMMKIAELMKPESITCSHVE